MIPIPFAEQSIVRLRKWIANNRRCGYNEASIKLFMQYSRTLAGIDWGNSDQDLGQLGWSS